MFHYFFFVLIFGVILLLLLWTSLNSQNTDVHDKEKRTFWRTRWSEEEEEEEEEGLLEDDLAAFGHAVELVLLDRVLAGLDVGAALLLGVLLALLDGLRPLLPLLLALLLLLLLALDRLQEQLLAVLNLRNDDHDDIDQFHRLATRALAKWPQIEGKAWLGLLVKGTGCYGVQALVLPWTGTDGT